ncbi:MAG: 2-C-methyl-D-erythritol 2,4-cyclodiphosphate synthase [Spirochaetaceae bacterium]|nr:2-C-methyl-D-erythritol 2,4-cyclodiphosphate synthase [Spirochaetaceae bacterium]
MKRISGIICAAGLSRRFDAHQKKEYVPLPLDARAHYTEKSIHASDEYSHSSVSVLSECVFRFAQIPEIHILVILIPDTDKALVSTLLQSDTRLKDIILCDELSYDKFYGTKKLCFLVAGADTRQKSVFNGLSFLARLDIPTDFVLIHDGARPFVSLQLIRSVITELDQYQAVIPGISVVDTQKKISEKNIVTENLARNSLRSIQTPQGFSFNLILQAHRAALSDNTLLATDDAELVLHYFPDTSIFVIEGERQNKKITYKEDIFSTTQPHIHINPPTIKIGIGYDLHRLKKGLPLVLGGIPIKSDKGCVAHSDGDVLLHAITDAILGATGFSDIGELFPPNDMTYKSAYSYELLQKAWNYCNADKTYSILNIDCVLILEAPALLPYRDQIRTSIAECLNIDKACVFVKAKTSEKVGPVGKRKAIEAYATVLVTHSGQTSPV